MPACIKEEWACKCFSWDLKLNDPQTCLLSDKSNFHTIKYFITTAFKVFNILIICECYYSHITETFKYFPKNILFHPFLCWTGERESSWPHNVSQSDNGELGEGTETGEESRQTLPS